MTIHQFPPRKMQPGFGAYSPERNRLAPPNIEPASLIRDDRADAEMLAGWCFVAAIVLCVGAALRVWL